MSLSGDKESDIIEAFNSTSRYLDQDQDQDSLLVKRRNDNHSPGL